MSARSLHAASANQRRIRWERRVLPLGRLPSGHRLSTTAFIARAGRGPKAYLQANVHGAEIAGNATLFELMRRLPGLGLEGTLVLVPQVNPRGLNQKIGDYNQGVYDFANGRNFNRVYRPLAVRRTDPRADSPNAKFTTDIAAFADRHGTAPWPHLVRRFRAEMGRALGRWSAALDAGVAETSERFAHTMQSLSFDADVMLDLHTGDRATHYLYSPAYCRPSTPYFNIPHVLEMQPRFGGAMDEAFSCPWAELAEELGARGRECGPLPEGYTVELGSMDEVSWEQARADADRLVSYLRYKGFFPGTPRRAPIRRWRCALEDYVSHIAPNSGLAFYDYQPGDRIRKGAVVARILSFADLADPARPARALTEVRAQASGILILRRASHIVVEGEPLFKMMTRIRAL